jgi:hypothetical protein
MTLPREIAYRFDPVCWAVRVLQLELKGWQQQFVRAPRGASIAVLTARQSGKTTVAALAMAHTALFKPGSLSVVACPAQRQSAEAVRRVKDVVVQADSVKLTTDNVYGLELENGSRVLALPGADDTVRGLTVDGWIIADEAARLTSALIAALRPMRARRPEARFAMLSTAWTRSDPFWQVWSREDDSWLRLKATADTEYYDPKYLEEERRALGEIDFQREYFGIPIGGNASPFTWDLYERATTVQSARQPPGPMFGPQPQPAQPFPNPFQQLRLRGRLS